MTNKRRESRSRLLLIEYMRNGLFGEIVGWYGAAAIVGAYALVSFEFVDSGSLLYQLLNVTGAVSIMYISFKKKAYQPGVINLIWSIIALIAIFKMIT